MPTFSAYVLLHERSASADLEADLQNRELGVDNQTKTLTFKNNAGTAYHVVTQEQAAVALGGTLTVTGSTRCNGGLLLPTLTAGSIPFIITGGTVSQDSGNLFWDGTNHRLGIGTNSPASSLHLRAATAIAVQSTYQNSAGTYQVGVDASGNMFIDESGVSRFSVAKTSGLVTVANALTVNAAFTANAGATVIGGGLIVGSNTTTQNLRINGPAASDRQIRFQTAGVNRWLFTTDNTAESGSNAGSNLSLNARDDSGGSIDNVFSIARVAGGAFAITRPLTASTTLGVTGNVGIGAASGSDRLKVVTSTSDDGIVLTDGTNTLAQLIKNGSTTSGRLILRSAGTAFANFDNASTSITSTAIGLTGTVTVTGAFATTSTSVLGNSSGLKSTRAEILGGSGATAGLLLSTSTSDATNKEGRIKSGSYTNAQAAVSMIWSSNQSAQNVLLIGGGSGAENAATSIDFYTASAVNTLTGTRRGGFSSSGVFDVAGSASITGSLAVTTTVGIGNVADASTSLWIRGSLSGGAALKGLSSQPTIVGAGLTEGVALYAQVTCSAGTTMGDAMGLYVGNHQKGAGATIGQSFGVYVADQFNGSTNNYAIYTNTGKVYFGDTLTAAGGITSVASTSGGWYEEGTFTATLTGVTTTVTGTARFVRIGKSVTLYLPTLQGTSNSTAATLTGMPSGIYPARSQAATVSEIYDNGLNYMGQLSIQTSGSITLLFRSSLTGGFTATFTSANNKGVGACVFAYSMA